MKKDISAILVGAMAVLYLINPTAGFLEFLPDNLPIIGNIDEAAAVLIIISVLQHFGIQVPTIFKEKFGKAQPKDNGKPVISIDSKK